MLACLLACSVHCPSRLVFRSSRPQMAPTKFVSHTWAFVNAEVWEPFVGWNDDGTAIVIRDVDAFAANVLPNFFKSGKWISYQRNLNKHGFAKVSSPGDPFVAYAHPNFTRNTPDKLASIRPCTRSSAVAVAAAAAVAATASIPAPATSTASATSEPRPAARSSRRKRKRTSEDEAQVVTADAADLARENSALRATVASQAAEIERLNRLVESLAAAAAPAPVPAPAPVFKTASGTDLAARVASLEALLGAVAPPPPPPAHPTSTVSVPSVFVGARSPPSSGGASPVPGSPLASSPDSFFDSINVGDYFDSAPSAHAGANANTCGGGSDDDLDLPSIEPVAKRQRTSYHDFAVADGGGGGFNNHDNNDDDNLYGVPDSFGVLVDGGGAHHASDAAFLASLGHLV